MFEEIQRMQEIEREGWMLKDIAHQQPSPSGMSVLDKLAASLQSGDVALVLTRADLLTLASMVEKSWKTDDEFKILGNLKKLMEAKCP